MAELTAIAVKSLFVPRPSALLLLSLFASLSAGDPCAVPACRCSPAELRCHGNLAGVAPGGIFDAATLKGLSALRRVALLNAGLRLLRPSGASPLSRAAVLDFSGNLLDAPGIRALAGARVQVLNLSANRIATFAGLRLPALRVLDLSHNPLRTFEAPFPALTTLRLAGHSIREAPVGSLVALQRLEVLDLSRGPLRTFNLTAGGPALRLRALNVSHNRLEVLALGASVRNLQHLDAAHNLLSSLVLHPALRASLRGLLLADNRLTSIVVSPEAVGAFSGVAGEFSFQRNRWPCSCETAQFFAQNFPAVAPRCAKRRVACPLCVPGARSVFALRSDPALSCPPRGSALHFAVFCFAAAAFIAAAVLYHCFRRRPNAATAESECTPSSAPKHFNSPPPPPHEISKARVNPAFNIYETSI